jgi:hypothetical protein
MILKVSYNDDSEIFYKELIQLITNKYPLIEVEGYHENKLKERNKSFKLKGGYGARKSPFMILIDDDKIPVKAFYTEANECSLDNIEKVLDYYIPYKNKDNESTSN